MAPELRGGDGSVPKGLWLVMSSPGPLGSVRGATEQVPRHPSENGTVDRVPGIGGRDLSGWREGEWVLSAWWELVGPCLILCHVLPVPGTHLETRPRTARPVLSLPPTRFGFPRSRAWAQDWSYRVYLGGRGVGAMPAACPVVPWPRPWALGLSSGGDSGRQGRTRIEGLGCVRSAASAWGEAEGALGVGWGGGGVAQCSTLGFCISIERGVDARTLKV